MKRKTLLIDINMLPSDYKNDNLHECIKQYEKDFNVEVIPYDSSKINVGNNNSESPKFIEGIKRDLKFFTGFQEAKIQSVFLRCFRELAGLSLHEIKAVMKELKNNIEISCVLNTVHLPNQKLTRKDYYEQFK